MKSKLSLTKKVLVKLSDEEITGIKGGGRGLTRLDVCTNSPLCVSEPACSEPEKSL